MYKLLGMSVWIGDDNDDGDGDDDDDNDDDDDYDDECLVCLWAAAVYGVNR